MQKLYVIVSPDGRTPEQVADIREAIKSDVEEGLAEDVELLLPTEGIEGVAADVDVIVKADVVVSTLGSMYNRDCRICNFVASEYAPYGVYEEDWVANIVANRRAIRQSELQSMAEIPEHEEEPEEPVEEGASE